MFCILSRKHTYILFLTPSKMPGFSSHKIEDSLKECLCYQSKDPPWSIFQAFVLWWKKGQVDDEACSALKRVGSLF